MKASIFACALALIAAKAMADHPVRQELVDEIKLKADSWEPKAVEDNHLRHIPEHKIRSATGNLGVSRGSRFSHAAAEVFGKLSDLFRVNKGSAEKHEFLKLKQGLDTYDDMDFDWTEDKEMAYDESSDLPKAFSWRDTKPECVGPIEDQGECGSCWAFSSSGMISDRFCIHSEGKINTRLSQQELINCNYENYGCEGGYLMTSMDYLMTEGSVPLSCMPYSGLSETCTYRCADGDQSDYQKYYCKPGSLNISANYDEIKRDLYHNGPIMVGLTMYEDFMNYKGGLYRHIAGDYVGGHAMKMVGWGYDDQYGLWWELQNQWTTDWGEDGFIRIVHKQIGIDSVGISCMPDLV